MSASPIAIVGAGIAGLACARRLQEAGRAVVLFDKGRRVGGRMATRRVHGEPRAQFDHGAQFFTARDPAFRAEVDRWAAAGWVREWESGDEPHWVGQGSNRGLAEELAAGLRVHSSTRVEPIVGRELRADGASLGIFTEIVVTAPLAQARALLAGHALAARLGGEHAPCWALMAAFAEPLGPVPPAAAPFQWIARDSATPGRPPGEAWVLHADEAWSREHLERPAEWACAALLGEWSHQADRPLTPVHARAHRWRYAKVETPVGQPFLRDATGGLTVAGDGLLGPRVECAWLSGRAAADAILAD